MTALSFFILAQRQLGRENRSSAALLLFVGGEKLVATMDDDGAGSCLNPILFELMD
jgi:hypothetical protein